MSDSPSASPAWWRARARHTCRRVNAGWWLDAYLPVLLVLSIATAIGLLLVRRGGGEVDAVLIGYALALVGGAVGSWLFARRRFETERDGLVRLEAQHRLKNRLTAASDGVGEWPPPQDRAEDGLAWRWQRSMWHPVVSMVILAAAILIPVQPAEVQARRTVEEPLAWSEIEEWVETLEEEDFIEEDSLRKLREQVRQLRAQPMQDWYSHSSLEAGDSLKQQTEQAIRELERDLHAAMSALAALEPYQDSMPAGMREAWQKFMDQAMDGLDGANLPIDPELLSQLKDIDPSQLRQLTPEELAALKEALKNGCKACKKCDGDGTNLVAVAVMSQMWGNGGITRGPGEAPLFMSDKETQLGTTTMETLQNNSFERAALGDTLAVGEAEHEIDESLYQGPQAAGDVASAGEGGDAVWRNPLDPDEQDVLKRYFK